MILPPLAYKDEYRVQTLDIDRKKRMTVPALVKIMQETSMQNVMQMKVSAWDLEPWNLSWVLFRKHLKINRFPMIGEKLTVVTYSCGFEKFFTFRDFKVFDAAGEMIAFSASTWLLMDIAERRMARIPDFILALEPKMPTEAESLPRVKLKLPIFGEAQHSKTYQVGWFDLDFNGHLNNAFYAQWMMEALPDAILDDGTLDEFHIFYKLEAHWKDNLRSEVQQLEDKLFLHRLVRIDDGKELAQGMTRFV